MVSERSASFVWDQVKEDQNIVKHGVDFKTAAKAFIDPNRKIYIDAKHSQKEERFFCLGRVDGKVLMVRFLWRDEKIRIIGAGYWRKGETYYDQKDF